ncbi:glutathione S-transferase family protein [Rhizobium rhizogenes]|uniref:glutathione S-transferase family protein n=1 Tax=Rhizobium rhizogenes TaxID=359 RepID=UPI001573C2B8|nr:glutathione S-transferase family protein [Rhizobium rhizogenes]NTH22885.1 glutathione S-transferase family protein [Rhizobium rhizogenes]NTH35914.1 glutathione S-transferase family protein [Rhizobium rhizogenes]
MIKLYDSKLSGNAWKVRLLLRHLGIPFERVTLNLAEGTHKSPEFSTRNPFQRIPVVELGDGSHLCESGAILLYFGEQTSLLPSDPVDRAGVTAWLFYDQGDLSRFLAYPRFFAMIGQTEKQAALISQYKAIGEPALVPLEKALSDRPWLAGAQLSVADFALYPYIKLAPQGGYDLTGLPAIQAWLLRFEALPAYEPLVPETQS